MKVPPVSAKTVGSGREYTVDEVLAIASTSWEQDAEDAVFEGFRVKRDSQRYQLFKQGRTCVRCGLEGTVFLLQRNMKDKTQPPDRAHFNLFGRTPDGELVLMTKDHIVPKSKGGKNNASNYQTMCFTCNYTKADT